MSLVCAWTRIKGKMSELDRKKKSCWKIKWAPGFREALKFVFRFQKGTWRFESTLQPFINSGPRGKQLCRLVESSLKLLLFPCLPNAPLCTSRVFSHRGVPIIYCILGPFYTWICFGGEVSSIIVWVSTLGGPMCIRPMINETFLPALFS